jgi:DNA-binding Lrp family transcriptional regulator
MKNIRPRLIKLFKEGYCTPQIAKIAKEIKEPSTTIHYNIKKLEKEGTIKTYKAVFDYKKIDEGFCVYLFVKLTAKAGAYPDRIVGELARYEEVESADLLAGEWDMVLKVRTKDQDEFYDVLKSILAREGVEKTTSLISLKQVKTEFVLLKRIRAQ